MANDNAAMIQSSPALHFYLKQKRSTHYEDKKKMLEWILLLTLYCIKFDMQKGLYMINTIKSMLKSCSTQSTTGLQ